jgi:hypothetical protein
MMITVVPRPARCYRHHVWMAACPDCRDAHATPTDTRKDPAR